MKLNEFYTPSEFKKTDEYKHFVAEQYFSTTENKKTSEVYDKCEETPSISKSDARKSKNNSYKGKTKNARQKIMNFTTEVGTTMATTAMAAVVSVVALSDAFARGPTISDFLLDVQANSVYYEFVIEDMSDELDYYVIVENQKHEFEYKIEDNKVANTATNLYNESAYTLSIVGESKDNLTTTTYYQTNFVTHIAAPQIQLGTPTLSGINTYSVPYEIKAPNADAFVYRSLTLNIVYNDGATDTIETPYVASKGEITVEDVPIEYTSMKCSAQFTYSRIGESKTTTLKSQSVERELTEEFALLETRVGLFEYSSYYGEAHMRFAWRGYEDAYVYVKTGTDETSAQYYPEAYIKVDIDGGETQITYDLRYDNGADSGANGLIYMDGGSITVDCADMPTGNINAANPGDLSRSYNANGTVNYYMETAFDCDDPDAYWEITLSNSKDLYFIYTGRDAVAAMENLPIGDEISGYSIIESVVKEIDGIYYLIYSNTPSGDTGESSWVQNTYSTNYTENGDGSYTVNVYFNNYNAEFDFDSTTLIIDGVTKKITQADLTFDEQRNRYEYSFNHNTLPTLSVNMRIAYKGMTLTDPNYKVKGDLFKQVNLNINYENL